MLPIRETIFFYETARAKLYLPRIFSTQNAVRSARALALLCSKLQPKW